MQNESIAIAKQEHSHNNPPLCCPRYRAILLVSKKIKITMEIPQFHPCSINYLVIRKINEVEYRVEYGWNYKKFHPCSFMCALCLYYW